MPFDLAALLREHLLTLLVLAPLGLIVVLIALRSRRDDPWSQSRKELLNGSRTTHLGTESPQRVALPTLRADLPLKPLPSPESPAVAPPVVAPVAALVEAPVEAAVAPPVVPPVVTPVAPPTTAPTPSAPTARSNEVETDTSHIPTVPAALDEPLAPSVLGRGAATPLLAPRRRASDGPAPLAAPVVPRRRATDRLGGPHAPASGPVPVLIVDDSAVVRAKLGKLLSSNGFAVTTARQGQEALEALAEQWFAVLITDLEMPEMDGFELIAHVSGDLLTENLPIIAITGHESLQAQVHDAKGLYGIFKKPWNDREMLQRVSALSMLRPRV